MHGTLRAALMGTGLALSACTGGGHSSPAPPPEPAPGALVPGFGTGGVALSDASTRDDTPRAATYIGTKLYVVGDDQLPGAGDRRWRIEKWCT